MGKIRNSFDRWVDNTKMAIEGIGMVLKDPIYIAIALLGFSLFAYLFAMFQDGTSTWSLLWSGIGSSNKISLLGDVWVRVAHNFVNPWGLILTVLAILQGLNIALLIYGLRAKTSREHTVAGLEAGGVGATIGIVALGCPTCGTSLFIPFLTMLLGSSAMALAEVLSWILTLAAAILLIHAARKLGQGAYVETMARRHKNAKS